MGASDLYPTLHSAELELAEAGKGSFTFLSRLIGSVSIEQEEQSGRTVSHISNLILVVASRVTVWVRKAARSNRQTTSLSPTKETYRLFVIKESRSQLAAADQRNSRTNSRFARRSDDA